MYDNISEEIQLIFEDFINELESYQTLCKLKDIKFTDNNIPNYRKRIIQQLYLLRYYPAYFVEYYDIFRDIALNKLLDFPWHIVSIGCGCCIDYSSLCEALYSCRKQNIHKLFTYTGYDKINWYRKDDITEEHDVAVHIMDIKNLDMLPQKTNLIIFPKSIGEFNKKTLDSLCNTIESTNFKSNKIVIVNSMREKRISTDVDNLQFIIKTFNDIGFYTNDNINEYSYFDPNKIKGLTNIYRFSYPDTVKSFISNLIENCEEYKSKGQSCSNCEEILNRFPILTVNHIFYQIISVER